MTPSRCAGRNGKLQTQETILRAPGVAVVCKVDTVTDIHHYSFEVLIYLKIRKYTVLFSIVMFQLRKENTEKLIFLFTEVVEGINARMKPFLQEKLFLCCFL